MNRIVSKLLKDTSILLLVLIISITGCSKMTFTVEGWRNANQIERQKMINSLMRNYDPVGWTEAEIISLLGPESSSDPEFSGSFRGYDTDQTLVYALGAYRFSYIKLLVVTLNGENTVTKWEVVTYSM